jgi:hypothetical protein
MTPDELRERCEKALDSIITFDLPTNEEAGKRLYDGQAKELEPLCREMIAEGLERACAYYSNQIHHDMDDYPDKFVKWCRQEAQRVKEGS